jgi:hypothetical protein
VKNLLRGSETPSGLLVSNLQTAFSPSEINTPATVIHTEFTAPLLGLGYMSGRHPLLGGPQGYVRQGISPVVESPPTSAQFEMPQPFSTTEYQLQLCPRVWDKTSCPTLLCSLEPRKQSNPSSLFKIVISSGENRQLGGARPAHIGQYGVQGCGRQLEVLDHSQLSSVKPSSSLDVVKSVAPDHTLINCFHVALLRVTTIVSQDRYPSIKVRELGADATGMF